MNGGEHPAADQPREPVREAPASERPAAAKSPVRRGVTAALVIFAIAVAVEVAALALVRLSGDPYASVDVFLWAGLAIFIVGLYAALTVSERLPREARLPFWAAGVVCALLAMVLWGLAFDLAGPRMR